MNEIYEEKERFVRLSLKSLLFDIDSNIIDVYYNRGWLTSKEEIFGEFVYIIFKDGTKKVIDVTCDSIYGIAKDVVNKLYN